jgi:hypothetical protein
MEGTHPVFDSSSDGRNLRLNYKVNKIEIQNNYQVVAVAGVMDRGNVYTYPIVGPDGARWLNQQLSL